MHAQCTVLSLPLADKTCHACVLRAGTAHETVHGRRGSACMQISIVS